MKNNLILLITITLLYSTNTICQQDTCTLKQSESLSLLYDYNTMYSIVKYIEIYSQLEKDERISGDMKEIHDQVIRLACSIFSEDDIVSLSELLKKNQLANLSEINVFIDQVRTQDIQADEILPLLIKDDSEYQDIIKKLQIHLEAVIDLIQRKYAEKLILKDGLIPEPGLIDYYLGNYHESLYYYNTKLKSEQDSSIINLLFRARNYKATEAYDTAIICYKEALKLYPENADLHYELAALYFYYSRDDSAAGNYLAKALKINPEHYGANMLSARLFLMQAKYSEAKNIFNSLIELYPETIEIYIERGSILIFEGDYENAGKDFMRVLDVDSTNYDALHGLCGVYLSKMEVDTAYSLIRKSLKLYPDDYDMRVLLGMAYMDSEYYDSCIICYSDVINDSISGVALNNLGFCQMKNDQYDQAMLTFQKLISLYNDEKSNRIPLAFAYNNLGQCYMKQELYSEALESVEFSLGLYPENPCAMINKLMVEDLMGSQLDDPCKTLDRASNMQLIEYCGEDLDKLRKQFCKKR